jgi:hypothetical protein
VAGGWGKTQLGVTRRKASRSRHSMRRKTQRGGGLGHAGSTHGVSVARRTQRGSFRSVLDPARWCLRRRRRMSEIGTHEVKAAPADEARAVVSLEAPRGAALGLLNEGTWGSRKQRHHRGSLGRIDRSWPVRIARPSSPTARTARTARAGTGRSLGTPRCAARIQCAHHDAKLRKGPRVRS